MAKFPTFPTLFDECKTLSISKLKQWDYLKPNHLLRGDITWSRNGSKTGGISIVVNTQTISPYIELDYQCNKVPINYKVQFIKIPSNLMKGFVWYFVCPQTGERCRKLYLVDTYFLSRKAFRNCMYEKQTESPKNRSLGRQWEKLTKRDKAFEKVYSKYFKKFYNGLPTKQYLKLLKQIKAGKGISEEALLLS